MFVLAVIREFESFESFQLFKENMFVFFNCCTNMNSFVLCETSFFFFPLKCSFLHLVTSYNPGALGSVSGMASREVRLSQPTASGEARASSPNGPPGLAMLVTTDPRPTKTLLI